MSVANRAVNITEAGTTTVIASGDYDPGTPPMLHRVVVNTGATDASVELQYADDDETIATIDASNPSIGQTYMLRVGGRGLKVVVVGSPDVTITWSA